MGREALRPSETHHSPDKATVHMKILIACVELGRTLSHKVNPDAFLFKATKGW
jgi:hypothetical protein